MLKAELHIHAQGDPEDSIDYSPRELIDFASRQGFEVLAFACHNKVVFTKKLENHAQTKNILLIPGVEKTIEGKHLLLYNLTEGESQKITSFRKLEEFKTQKEKQKQPFLVIAAHPFHYGSVCLKNKVLEHLDLFDLWEYSFFYTKLFNKNKKTLRLAQKYQKPLLGSSDVHKLAILGKTYSLINSEKNLPALFQALKNNQLEIKTSPLSFPFFCLIFLKAAFSFLRKTCRNFPNHPKTL